MTAFIFYSTYNAISKVKDIIDNKNRKVTIITNDNDTIRTTNTYFFVGRTNRYVFLYNLVDSTNDDIPVGEIKKISYK